MSFTGDLFVGLGQILNDAGIADFPWDGSSTPTTGAAVIYKDMPDNPDRVVSLTPWGAGGDQPLLTLGRQPFQARFRGTVDPRDVDELGDAVFNVLHGLTDREFGSVHVIQILRESSLPLGQDEQERRWMRSDNYLIDVDLPGSLYRPA